MAPVGIGLIGLGRHGIRYAQHLLEPLANARLVAVSRRDTALGASFAVTHRVRFYRDYRELIADPRVQAVVVVTQPSLTRSICLEAVQAGKPLLIEKPLATTGSAAREMVRAAVSAQVPLMTAQTLRFEATVLAMKAELAAVGPPQYFVLTSRVEPRPEVWREPTDYAGRGVLLEIGIHLLDLVRFLTGEEVAEVRCELDRAAPGKPESRALVSLRTSTNLAGIVDVSRVTGGRISRAEWVGTGGQMIADWVQHSLRTVSSGNIVKERPLEYRPTVAAVLQAFCNSLEHGTPMPVTGWDGQRAVEIADACYQSAETEAPVRVDPGQR